MSKVESRDERIHRIAGLIDQISTASAQLGHLNSGEPGSVKWKTRLGVAARKLMREIFGNDDTAVRAVDDLLGTQRGNR